MNNLHRQLAPISDAAWAQIEEEAARTLKRHLAARRVVDLVGPKGVDFPAIGTGHLVTVAPPGEGIAAAQREVQPLVELRVPFELSRQELEAIGRGAQDPDLDPVRHAARAAAIAEDRAVFLDRANLMTLTAPEWTVLTGGLRVLGANWDGSSTGVLTDRVGTLTTDFFVNLTDTDLVWTKTDESETTFTGTVQGTGEERWTASRNDLVFGSNAQLRSIVDVYAGSDGQERFVRDFVAAWDKVMMLDRYDVKGHRRYGPMAA